MRKLLFIPILILISITLSACNLLESKKELPIEMVAFNILTDEEENLIPVSPKDSIVKKVAVTADNESLIDNNYDKNEMYSVTFNNTNSDSFGNLIVFVDLDKKTVVGKGFSDK